MPRGDTMCSTKKIDERDRAGEQPTDVGVPVRRRRAAASANSAIDREPERVHDLVREQEVLEVDDREHDERDR